MGLQHNDVMYSELIKACRSGPLHCKQVLQWHKQYTITLFILSINETLPLTLNKGIHLDLSEQRIAVCSAFIFVVHCPMNRYYRKPCSSHMKSRYPFTNEHQMFPLSSMGTCKVVVVPERLSLAFSI